jgi:hypothetical protein
MIMRTDPTNESSPVIKRKFKPLDNPSNVLDVLQGVLLIKEGVIGNNVATGPLQHRHWRGCLSGTALDKFNEHTLVVGNETAANLHAVEQRLITFFAPHEVLCQQTRCIRFHVRKPKEVSTRQHVGVVATLNNTLSKLPPAFDDLQKVSDTDMMDVLFSKAPKGHEELMTDHGFDPQTARTAEFVVICERAGTKEALQTRKQSHDSDDDSSDDEVQRPKKPRKKAKISSYHNTRERDPNSVVKNTVPIRPTTLARARSSSTVAEKTIGRKRMLPNLSARTASRSTRRSMPNSTFSKRKPRRRRPSGPRPPRTLSPKKLTASRAKKANQATAKRIKSPQPKPRLVPTIVMRTATAARIVARPPTPTPNRKAAAGKLICLKRKKKINIIVKTRNAKTSLTINTWMTPSTKPIYFPTFASQPK